MTSPWLRSGLARIAVVGLSATALIALSAAPAYADTANASSNAATVQLAGNTLLTTGTCTAASPGGTSGSCGNVPIGLLGTQTTLSVGLLAQQAQADATGASAACAGAVGNGGTIQIGAGGACTFTPGSPSGGIQVNLGLLATIHADAIIAECTASSSGTATAQVQLVNATISLLTSPLSPPIPITSPIGPNTSVANLGSLLNVTLFSQPASQPAGTITATALEANVLGILGGPSLIHVTIGTVTCGPNAVTPGIPVIPLAGIPIALFVASVAGFISWRYWWTPRRNSQITSF